eukprot:1159827-Pelagomonas_calceolata.AAC.13
MLAPLSSPVGWLVLKGEGDHRGLGQALDSDQCSLWCAGSCSLWTEVLVNGCSQGLTTDQLSLWCAWKGPAGAVEGAICFPSHFLSARARARACVCVCVIAARKGTLQHPVEGFACCLRCFHQSLGCPHAAAAAAEMQHAPPSSLPALSPESP